MRKERCIWNGFTRTKIRKLSKLLLNAQKSTV